MSEKIQLHIIDFEETTINRLEEMFFKNPHLGIEVMGYAHGYISALNSLENIGRADVVLISAYLPDQLGIDLIPNIKKINPDIRIIVMVTKQTRMLAEVSREKGADDVIQKPFKIRKLIDAIEAAVGKERMEQAKKQDGLGPFEERFSGDEGEREERDIRPVFDEVTNLGEGTFGFDSEELEGDKPKQVVAVYSTSGAGKTTLIANIAAAVQKHSEYKPKICIIDFNLLFPSIVYHFHQDDLIMCKRNIYNLCEDINDLDEHLIQQALITHEPTGIKIINTPPEVDQGYKQISPESIEHLIAALKEMFDLILIDTSSAVRENTTSLALTLSDKTLVVLEPNVTSVLHTRKFVSMMKVLESSLSEKLLKKFNFILNKSNPKTGVSADDVKKAIFGVDVKSEIPDDPNVTFLSNNGRFVIDEQTAAARPIKELANLVYPLEYGEFDFSSDKKGKRKSSGLFGTFFKKK